MTAALGGGDPGAPAGFAPEHRESFLDAIARHRRSAWQVTVACGVAFALLGLVVALLLAPLLYCLLGLALDLVNLVVPMPDLLGWAGRLIDRMTDAKATIPPERYVWVTLLAALPGLVLFGLAALALGRALLRSPVFARGEAAAMFGRPADPQRLDEIRLANTVEEMAVAAMISPPRVVFVAGSANAACFGPDAEHATLLVGTALPERLTRAQMQGVAAYLVASVASGDMRIGMRTALTIGLFSLAGCLATGWSDRTRFFAILKLLRALAAPTEANLPLIEVTLADPFGGKSRDRGPHDDKLTWREWAVMPLMGPLFLSGFLAGLVTTMLLSPLVSLAWRQRKYMADAAAVQLTRDADALDGALGAIAGGGAALTLPPWAYHLCVVAPGGSAKTSLVGSDILPIFLSPQSRHRALVKLGASAERAMPGSPLASLPKPILALFAAAGAVVVALISFASVLLAWLSLAISGLFTIMPATILHYLLRWLGKG